MSNLLNWIYKEFEQVTTDKLGSIFTLTLLALCLIAFSLAAFVTVGPIACGHQFLTSLKARNITNAALMLLGTVVSSACFYGLFTESGQMTLRPVGYLSSQLTKEQGNLTQANLTQDALVSTFDINESNWARGDVSRNEYLRVRENLSVQIDNQRLTIEKLVSLVNSTRRRLSTVEPTMIDRITGK